MKLRSFFKKNMKLHIFFLSTVFLTVLFYLLYPLKSLMTFISGVTLFIKQLLAAVFSIIPFSVAEITVILGIIAALFYIAKSIADAIRQKPRLNLIYRRFIFALSSVVFTYFMLCLFLNASYASPGFQEYSGIYARPAAKSELYNTTKYFVLQLNETAGKVKRDDYGRFDENLDDIFSRSISIYDNIQAEFPFLAAASHVPKRVMFSKLMSYFSYTGFYFPFTGEANINIDAPKCLIPATIAHEFAHQRGISSEQEANFVAILAATSSGDPVFEYSGWLSGYIYLSNALYKHDYNAFAELYALLPESVTRDMSFNNDYWKQFESKAAEISNAVYDTFLVTQGQELGIASYGAVVDLLIVYYEGR